MSTKKRIHREIKEGKRNHPRTVPQNPLYPSTAPVSLKDERRSLKHRVREAIPVIE